MVEPRIGQEQPPGQPAEIELKLRATREAQEALWHRNGLGPFTVRTRSVERQINRYYERADGEPLPDRASLRWRLVQGESSGTLTLKLPGSIRDPGPPGIVERPEYRAELPADADPLTVSPLPEPLRRLGDLVGPGPEGIPLRVAFEACTERRVIELVGEDAIVELALDHVTLPDAPDFELREVEAELKQGPREALDALAKLLAEVPGLQAEERSKHARMAEYHRNRR